MYSQKSRLHAIDAPSGENVFLWLRVEDEGQEALPIPFLFAQCLFVLLKSRNLLLLKKCFKKKRFYISEVKS
ncbi:hypothetical protein D791_02969 [Nitrincola nitratireducens]|uniref:Uncharacterized protein n=1 Tax=Nitrincola nitratireducens TaxID=1229521 RepID=W9USW7_9GAMM|nr:hypothetical protein D791_02969 [Nitrincola nitratireducens]